MRTRGARRALGTRRPAAPVRLPAGEIASAGRLAGRGDARPFGRVHGGGANRDALLEEKRLGASRRQAMQNIGERTGSDEISSFVRSLLQSDELGVPIGAALRVQADDIDKLLAEGKVFFLDVREPKELEEFGTRPGYVNIPLGQLEARLNELPKDKAILTA